MLMRKSLIQIFTRNYNKPVFRRARGDAITNILLDKPDVIQWDSVRKELMQMDKSINTKNIDGLIISKCFNGARLDIAKSYLEHVKSNNLSISDAFIIKLIRLYYAQFRNKKESFTKKDEEEVLNWCNHIISKYQILDPLSADNIIHGLCLTSKWRDAENFFEMIVDKKPEKSTFCAFISRAIHEGEDKLVWKYLDKMAETQQLPRTFIFSEWFKKHQDDKKKIDQMLEFMSENGFLMPEIDSNEFADALKKNYHASLVSINRKGKCPSCHSQLPGVKLMDSEFKKLAKTFLEEIIIKSDIFIKSNPEEIERFKMFVEKTIPYDCVIDGLNVAFSQGNKLSNLVYAKNIAQVVKHFVDKNQKCLVIGRKYMEGWPRNEMKFIKQNSSLFLVEDLSSDDLFLLYAAFKSGPQTNIFSRDLMRQHSHLLNLKMRNIFRRWQQEHQFTLVSVKQRLIVRDPIQFEIKAHKVNFKWHVPFTKENVQSSTQTFELPAMWLCLREKLSTDK